MILFDCSLRLLLLLDVCRQRMICRTMQLLGQMTHLFHWVHLLNPDCPARWYFTCFCGETFSLDCRTIRQHGSRSSPTSPYSPIVINSTGWSMLNSIENEAMECSCITRKICMCVCTVVEWADFVHFRQKSLCCYWPLSIPMLLRFTREPDKKLIR